MISNYRISTHKEELDFRVIHEFIGQSYWASGIPKDVLETAIANSLCFGVFHNAGEQVGFARMVTDKATFAYLADVFILEPHRGKGLSKWLMQTILAHPDLQGLRRMALATRDAHTLYEQFGFRPLANPQTFMELWDPEVYSKA